MNGMCPNLEDYGKGWNRGFSDKDFVWILGLGFTMLTMTLWSIFLAGIPPFLAMMMGTVALLPLSYIGFTKIETMSFSECLRRYIALSDNTYYFLPEIPVEETTKKNKKKEAKHLGINDKKQQDDNIISGEKDNTGHPDEETIPENEHGFKTTAEGGTANDSNLENLGTGDF